MSMNNKNQNSPKRDKMRMAFIGSIIIMFIIVGIGITSFYVGKREALKNKSTVPIINVSRTTGQQVMGTKIYNLSGQITKVEDSKITFVTTIKGDDGNPLTRELSALIKPSTQLLKWDLTKLPSANQPNNTKEKISIDQLKPGQRIVVKFNEDINSLNEIEATNISLLVTPTAGL